MEAEDDSALGCIGSMFDTAHDRSVLSITVSPADAIPIQLNLRHIDGEPGHVQSGQYIWPAAEKASRYLYEHWESLRSRVVVELGAGCGMAGITAAKLGTPLTHVVLTDHDPGAVRLLEENTELNDVADRCKAMHLVCS